MNLPSIIRKDENHFYYSCGCVVPHINYIPKIDYDKLNLNCPDVYELLAEGIVSNCFQLETSLGKHWTKEVKPKNIQDLSLVISIIRPSTLNAKELDGHSIATHIVKRRNKLEEVTYPHPLLEPILKETEGYQNYQEQIIQVAQVIAGFNPNQADELRRGVGKKLADVIAKIKTEFMDGCKKTGLVDEQTAEQIFVSVQAASRYSFNRCCSGWTTLTYTDGTSDILESAFNTGSWKGKKTYSLKFWERPKYTRNLDNLVKNSEIVENEIEDIKYAGEQIVYRVTLKRRKITDRNSQHGNFRPHYTITVTGNHKHPTRCHGEVKTCDLIEGVHSLYCYDEHQEYRPKYKHAASRVIKIEKLGLQKVYDVTMKAPYHNFLCDGVFTCNSHSVGYGVQTYLTAWTKTHFPIEFYTSNLRLNENRGGKKDKIFEEKSGMIKEAGLFDIKILPPHYSYPVSQFSIENPTTIRFGISNVKMTGENEAKTVQEILGTLTNKNWLNILFYIGTKLKSASFENLCLIGFFDGLDISRESMVYEYNTYRKLTNKEVEFIIKNLNSFSSLKDSLIYLLRAFNEGIKGGISRKDRVSKIEDLIKTLENPPHSLLDTPLTINKHEKDLLGVALTYSDVEARTLCGVFSDTTCKEFEYGKNQKPMSIACNLGRVKEHKIKNSEKLMAFCSLQDDSGVVESVVIFAQVYEEYGNLLFDGNTIVAVGERSADRKSFILNKAIQI